MNMEVFSEPSNAIELFTFDLTTFFFEDDFVEINSHEEGGVSMVEYEKALPWLELKLFNRVIFRVFNEKGNILGSSHLNIKFPAIPDLVNQQSVADLTNALYKIYGWDDDSKGEWNSGDFINLKTNKFERIWTLGEGRYIYTVKMVQDKKGGLELHIMFFNHLLKLINQTISFSANEFGA